MNTPTRSPDQETDKKDVFLRFQQAVFNEQDLSDKTLEHYLHPGFVDHSSWPGEGRGIEGFRSRISTWQAAFGQATATNIALVGEGVMLAVLHELRANHTGEFMGIAPTDEPVYIPAIDFYRIEDGKIYERWGIYDYLTTALQIRAEIHLETAPDGTRTTPQHAGGQAVGRAKAINLETEPGRDDTAKVEQNKVALFRFQTEVFNTNDWSIPTLENHLSPDIIDHNAYPGDPPGLNGVQSRFSAWQAAFEDPDEENMSLAGEGELLAVLYNLHAVHSGAFMGIAATGNRVVIPGIEFLRFEGGLIAEHWGIYDFRSTARQLGTILTLKPREQEALRHPNQSVSERQKRRPFATYRN